MSITLTEQYKAGERAGRRWAEHAASPEELERLQAFYDQSRDGGRTSFADWFELEMNAPWRNMDVIAAAIMGFDEENQLIDEVREVADSLFCEGDEEADDDFLCGFVCGAIDQRPD